jgi:hypothetical protein
MKRMKNLKSDSFIHMDYHPPLFPLSTRSANSSRVSYFVYGYAYFWNWENIQTVISRSKSYI